jgi:hypothetical protein
MTVTRTTAKSFLDRPGFEPRVTPSFRTQWGAYCGIEATTLVPEEPLFVCWNSRNGASVGVDFAAKGRPGSFWREERARGYRPGGFPILKPGAVFEWRCDNVNRFSAERCSTKARTVVFRCVASRTGLRCANIHGRGFALARDGSFDVF